MKRKYLNVKFKSFQVGTIQFRFRWNYKNKINKSFQYSCSEQSKAGNLIKGWVFFLFCVSTPPPSLSLLFILFFLYIRVSFPVFDIFWCIFYCLFLKSFISFFFHILFFFAYFSTFALFIYLFIYFCIIFLSFYLNPFLRFLFPFSFFIFSFYCISFFSFFSCFFLLWQVLSLLYNSVFFTSAFIYIYIYMIQGGNPRCRSI